MKEEEFKQAVSEQLYLISSAYKDKTLTNGAFDVMLDSLRTVIYHHTGVQVPWIMPGRVHPVEVKINLTAEGEE